ncbi:MAG: helix-turn-helix transcriptional regulator [Candidatus Eremiobacteraeota bacterium]|nr:helix-turn-helix transcriptional regulator [Candidatus Eremiobacteraeota bacterium]
MNARRFLYTPAALRDFRELYASERLNRGQALDALKHSMDSAVLQRTKATGAQVYRSVAPREHYLLVGETERNRRPVLAVASLKNEDADGWWLPAEGDLASDTVVGLGAHPGSELRFARESLGLSVEELARLVNLPAARLKVWENGQFKSWKSLRKVARLVGKLHETRVLARAGQNSQSAGQSAPSLPASR